MPTIRPANRRDLDRGRSGGPAVPPLDRPEPTGVRLRSMAQGSRRTAALPDPVGEIGEMRMQPLELQVGRMRVPLGSDRDYLRVAARCHRRPDVTAGAAGAAGSCLKSGNATILRGGSEALVSNLAIAGCIHEELAAAGPPRDAVQVVEASDSPVAGRRHRGGA